MVGSPGKRVTNDLPPDGRSPALPGSPNSRPAGPVHGETGQESEFSPPIESGEAAARRPDAVNWEEALARVEGDRELLAEMATLFLETGPGLLSVVREALDRLDAGGLEHAAHNLKSSVGNFGAGRARDAALNLEKIGREGDLTHAEESYRALERMMQQLWPALAAMQKSEGSA